MTVKARRKLIKQQKKLMQERKAWEQMQTNFSYDEDFYKFCELKINLLNEEAEKMRYVLEMGCCE
ncbi:MAG: hypothetical protein MSA09_10780 [Lachnospiraceae bacterium]|nr:hypothetical protein [Lachnospiraceae bacterium]